MLSFVFPKVEREASARDYSRFAIGPLEGGYGTTLGNALRRVLLSSLPGAAVASVRINNVSHEFSTIPHVKEDTTRLILNVKRLRFRLDEDMADTADVRLEVRGEGPVTGSDLICPAGVEVVNPEQLLLTADSSEADLDIEMTVERGRGYLSLEDREGSRMALGEIPVDAIFSPVRRVRYNVEHARLGYQGGYDKLVLEVWTDGTIAPEDALRQSAQLLVDHLRLVSGVKVDGAQEALPGEEGIPNALYEQEIEVLGLNVRTYNSLRRAGITTVGEVLEELAKGDEQLLSIRNFGSKSMDELKERLRAMKLIAAAGPSEGGEALAEQLAEGLPQRGAAVAEEQETLISQAIAEPMKEPEEGPELGEEVPGVVEPSAMALDEAQEVKALGEEGELRLNDELAAALRKAMMGGGRDIQGDLGL